MANETYVYWDSKDIANGPLFDELLERILKTNPETFGYVKLHEDTQRDLIEYFRVDLDENGTPSDPEKIGNFVLYNYTNGPEEIPDNSVLPVLLRTSIMYLWGPYDPEQAEIKGPNYHRDILGYYQKWTLDVGDKLYVYSTQEPQWTKLTGEMQAQEQSKIIRSVFPPDPPTDPRILWLDCDKNFATLKKYDPDLGTWIEATIPGALHKIWYDTNHKEKDIYEYANDAIASVSKDYGMFLKHKMNELILIHISPDEKIQWDAILSMEEFLQIIKDREEECHEIIMTLYDEILGINALEKTARDTLKNYDDHVNEDESATPPHISHKKANMWDSKSDANHRHDIDPLVTIFGENVLTGTIDPRRLPDEIKERVIPIPDGIDSLANPISDEDRKGKYHLGNILLYDPDGNIENYKWYKIIDPEMLGTPAYVSGVLEFTHNWEDITTAEWKYVQNTPTTIAGYDLSATVYTKDEFEVIARNLISKLNDLDKALIYLMKPQGVPLPFNCKGEPRNSLIIQLGGYVNGQEVDFALHADGESDAIVEGANDDIAGLGFHTGEDTSYDNDDITSIYDMGKGMGSAWGLIYHTDKEENCHKGVNQKYFINFRQSFHTFAAFKGMGDNTAIITFASVKSALNPTKMDIGVYTTSSSATDINFNLEQKMSVVTILKNKGLGTSDENWIPVCWSECDPTDTQPFKTIGLVVYGDKTGYRAIYFKVTDAKINTEIVNIGSFQISEVYHIVPDYYQDASGKPCHCFTIDALDADNKISFINTRIFDLDSASATTIRRQYVSPNNVKVNCINNGFEVDNVNVTAMIVKPCDFDLDSRVNIGAFNFIDNETGHSGTLFYDFIRGKNDATHSGLFVRNVSEHTSEISLGELVPYDDFRSFYGFNHNEPVILTAANNTIAGKCAILEWTFNIVGHDDTSHQTVATWSEIWSPSNHFYDKGKCMITDIEPVTSPYAGTKESGKTRDLLKVTMNIDPEDGVPYDIHLLIYESLTVPGKWETLGGDGYSDATAYCGIFDSNSSYRNYLVSDQFTDVDLTNESFVIERYFDHEEDIGDLTLTYKYNILVGDSFYAKLAMGFQKDLYGEIMIGQELVWNEDHSAYKANSAIYAPRLHQLQACLSGVIEWDFDNLDNKLTLAENWLAMLTFPGTTITP